MQKLKNISLLATLLFSLGFKVAFADGLDISCEDSNKILSFVDSEHLRFRTDTDLKKISLVESAIKRLPEIMRSNGYPVLAAQYEARLLPDLESKHFQKSTEVCEHLGYGINRLMFIKAYVSQLDSFSDFYLQSEFEKKTSVISGHFVGVGVGTASKDNYLEVTEVVEGGPAYGKLFVGDRILKIDDRGVRGMSVEELRRRIRGTEGTSVQFEGLRKNAESFQQKVLRGHVFQKSVSHEWVEPGVLKIKIHRFFAQTASQIQQILSSQSVSVRGLILDLKDNPGGLLQAARDVVDLFVSHGVVVHLRGAYSDELWALNGGGFLKVPMVVLVNERTASASEIVAGALQDYGRALVVGRKTYGKSCVQNIYETETVLQTAYKGGLKLTTLWYYLPSGRSVRILTPDILIPDPTNEVVARLEMPYRWPNEIEVNPLMTALANHFESYLARARSLVISQKESDEIGKELIRQMQANRSDLPN